MAKQHIMVVGSYGRGNLGDDAFLLAVLELFPDKTIYINTADKTRIPKDIRTRVIPIATHGRKDILKKIQIFFRVQAIIYGGGDVWVELYGDRFPRKSLYQMALLNLCARLGRKEVYYIGCGIGKLSGYSLKLARFSAQLARHIIVRELRSQALLDLPNVEVAPDMTVMLPYYGKLQHKRSKKVFTIGISLLYFIPNPEKNFLPMIDQFLSFILSLPADSFHIILLPFLNSDVITHDDVWALEQLRAKLPEHISTIHIAETVEDCIDMLGKLDLLIGARLHANILATFSGTPSLGIAYRPKVSSFFADNTIGEYCIDIDALDTLPDTFWHMYHNYEDVARTFQKVSKKNLEGRKTYQGFAARYL